MEHKGSLSFAHGPATCPYPKPDESNQHSPSSFPLSRRLEEFKSEDLCNVS